MNIKLDAQQISYLSFSSRVIGFSLIFFYLTVFSSLAQSPKIDSLKALTELSLKPPLKTDAYNELSYALSYRDPKQSYHYAQKALKIALKIQYEKGQADAFNNLGLYTYNKSQYLKAENYHKKALNIYRQIKNKRGIAISLNNMGLIWEVRGDYDKALEAYQRSLKIMQKEGKPGDISMCLNNMGNVYYYLGSFEKARQYYEKCLLIDQEQTDSSAIANSLNNVSIIQAKLENPKKALEYSLKAFQISSSILDSVNMSYNLISLAYRYHSLKQINQAISALDESLVIAQNLADQYIEANVYKTYVKILNESEKPEEARIYAQKMLNISQKIQSKELHQRACELLGEIYTKLGQYKKAYEFQACSIVYSDSIMNDKRLHNIQALELEQKESINQQLKQAQILKDVQINNQKRSLNYRWWLLVLSGSIGLLLIVVLILMYRNQQLQKYLNERLKGEVKSRSKYLDQAQQKIQQIAFVNSHQVRRPLANILGLVSLFDNDKTIHLEHKKIIELIEQSAKELDEILIEINQQSSESPD